MKREIGVLALLAVIMTGARMAVTPKSPTEASVANNTAGDLRLHLAGVSGTVGHQTPVYRCPGGPRHDAAGRGFGVRSEARTWQRFRSPRHLHQRIRGPYRYCNRDPWPPYRPGGKQQLTPHLALSPAHPPASVPEAARNSSLRGLTCLTT